MSDVIINSEIGPPKSEILITCLALAEQVAAVVGQYAGEHNWY
jgi:hypothetical protein